MDNGTEYEHVAPGDGHAVPEDLADPVSARVRGSAVENHSGQGPCASEGHGAHEGTGEASAAGCVLPELRRGQGRWRDTSAPWGPRIPVGPRPGQRRGGLRVINLNVFIRHSDRSATQHINATQERMREIVAEIDWDDVTELRVTPVGVR
jgi:hypothetical protein